MNVNAKLQVKVTATGEGTNDLGNPTVSTSVDRALTFTPGTDAVTKLNILWKDTRTIAASGTDNLDLAGVLVDAFGTTVAAGEIVAIYVEAASANTNNVNIGGAATNPWVGPMGGTGVYALKPGAFVLFSDQGGWGVTAGTGDILKIANSGAGTSVDYNIIILGRTVAA